MSLNFGTPKAATGFPLPSSTTPTTGTPGFSFGAGDAKTTPQAKPALGLFGTPTTTTQAAGGFTLGGTPSSTFQLFTPATAATTSSLFGAAPTTPASATATTPSATALPQFNLGGSLSTAVAATTTPTLSFGATPITSTTSPGFSLGVKPTSAPSLATSTVPSLSIPASGTTSVAATASETAIPSGTLTYNQLEDAINKWTIDLEEQGKIFGNQAKQLNAWDRLLITNGEKVLQLNNGIERVKQQQHQLDQELDFVLAQQKELEDLIGPLEKELEIINVTDLDRNNTYQMAENMDAQLKHMSEDLKEIIEQLNEENKVNKMSNPITQIGKVLNAHMNSLQWIDRNTTKISTQLDSVTKLHDMNKRNHEFKLQRSFD